MTLQNPTESDPISSDEDLLALARELVERAFRRQLWLLFIDAEGRPLPVLPRIDIPTAPDPRDVDRVVANLRAVGREAGAVAIGVVYERPGPERLTTSDRQWLRMLAAGRSGPVPIRGPILAHARGLRWVAPEDLDDPSP